MSVMALIKSQGSNITVLLKMKRIFHSVVSVHTVWKLAWHRPSTSVNDVWDLPGHPSDGGGGGGLYSRTLTNRPNIDSNQYFLITTLHQIIFCDMWNSSRDEPSENYLYLSLQVYWSRLWISARWLAVSPTVHDGPADRHSCSQLEMVMRETTFEMFEISGLRIRHKKPPVVLKVVLWSNGWRWTRERQNNRLTVCWWADRSSWCTECHAKPRPLLWLSTVFRSPAASLDVQFKGKCEMKMKQLSDFALVVIHFSYCKLWEGWYNVIIIYK